MTTDCNRDLLLFHSLNQREVRGEFEGGSITSDGGSVVPARGREANRNHCPVCRVHEPTIVLPRPHQPGRRIGPGGVLGAGCFRDLSLVVGLELDLALMRH